MKKRITVLLIAGALLLGVLLLAHRREAPPAAAVPAVPPATATPAPTPGPTPAPTPSPTPVPTTAPRSRDWFGEAVFVGDSVTRALENHCRRHEELGEPLFLCEISLSVRNIAEDRMGVQYRGFIQLRIQLTKTHAYDTSIYDFGGITHENAEILF